MDHYDKLHEQEGIRHRQVAGHYEGEYGGIHLENSIHHDEEVASGGGSLRDEGYSCVEEAHDDHHSSRLAARHSQLLRDVGAASGIDNGHVGPRLEAVVLY